MNRRNVRANRIDPAISLVRRGLFDRDLIVNCQLTIDYVPEVQELA
jgi:hypothetical protein